MENVIVTTSGRPSPEAVKKAKETAKCLGISFIEREKRSVSRVMEDTGCDAIIVGTDKLKAHIRQRKEPFFFHPNSAMFRARHWMKSNEDPMVHACRLEEGDVFLDATLGLGSDAIIASLAIGKNGKVIGIENSPIISFIVSEGLKSYLSHVPQFDQALRKIKVVCGDHRNWLLDAPDDSVDVVYFDPMFEKEVSGSDGFDLLRPFASPKMLTEEIIMEAKRVARKRVVLKDHFRSSRFKQLGFHVHIRPSATYHFGTIELYEEIR